MTIYFPKKYMCKIKKKFICIKYYFYNAWIKHFALNICKKYNNQKYTIILYILYKC